VRIAIACPAPPGSRAGNRVTARRWAKLARELGHTVRIVGPDWVGRCDLLIALHARRSATAVRRARRSDPQLPIVVALTGTDLYHDLPDSMVAAGSLDLADRLVGFNALAARRLRPRWRRKLWIIYQSVELAPQPFRRPRRRFVIAVVGHLRPVKDPFRTVIALRRLRDHRSLLVFHAGKALTETMAQRARRWMQREPRYRWLGELTQARAQGLLAAADLAVLSSKSEGGAHLVGEAAIAGTPLLVSAIDGSLGLVGQHYPGQFPVGDSKQLAALIERALDQPSFVRRLRRAIERVAPRFDPDRERRSLARLLADYC
jgi:putative glycosyltransferase (TIGR04348 family)